MVTSMKKKTFTNTGKNSIAFGLSEDLKVAPGESIELSADLIKEKQQAIDNLIETGELAEGKKKVEEPEPEAEPTPEETPDVPEEEPEEPLED